MAYEIFSQIGGSLMTTLFWSLGAIMFIGLCGGIAYFIMNTKKYDVNIIMYSKRKGGWKTFMDKGAFIKNKKTGDVYGFKMKKEKETLPPPPYDLMMMSNKGNVIHMLQESTGEYYYLDMAIENPTENGKIASGKLRIIEGDIQLWMTNMIDKIYALYQKKKAWEVWLPYLVVAVSGVIAFMIIYSLLNKFEVLQTLAGTLGDVATSLKETAIVLKDVKLSGALVT